MSRTIDRTCLAISAFLQVVFYTTLFGKTIYVDNKANGANDGSSWVDAYNYLQSALSEARSSNKPVEILVAQGIYRPDEGANQTLGDREATFQLINGLTLKGGYAGLGHTNPNDRDIAGFMTRNLTGEWFLCGSDIQGDHTWDGLLTIDNTGTVTGGTFSSSEGPTFTFTGGNLTIDATGKITGTVIDSDGVTTQLTMQMAKSKDVIAGEGNAMIDEEDGIFVFIKKSSGYETILSGDLYANDVDITYPQNLLDEPSRTENSYHVVTGNGTDDTAILDGFIKNAGNANGSGDDNHGGGMLNDGSSPIVANCTFRGNSAADSGGGIENTNSSRPTITNCVFYNNASVEDGGGMDNCWYSLSIIDNCMFSNNSAGENGGGVCNDISCGTIVKNCIFISNSTGEKGGGMYNCHSSPLVTNCTFRENKAIESGGGMCNVLFCDMIVNNCIFAGNSTYEKGGAMANLGSNPTLNNCTFTGNRASLGNALACALVTDLDGQERRSQVRLVNCIVWNDSDGIWNESPSIINISHSNIQGGWPGEGNINADPLFAEPDYWDENGTPDDLNDDVWIDGDYHLQSKMGRWDPVSESWVVDKIMSPCIDAGDPGSPIGDEPEPNGGIINMGAYGGTAKASKSLSVVDYTDDFETGDFSHLPWELSGNADWTITSSQSYSGIYSAEAGTITHDESTTLQVTLNCAFGYVDFYCKVSSESGFDYLYFYIDGEEQGKWSGEEDWTRASFPVATGTRTFKWMYSKDSSVSDGLDTAWIDNIMFPSN